MDVLILLKALLAKHEMTFQRYYYLYVHLPQDAHVRLKEDVVEQLGLNASP